MVARKISDIQRNVVDTPQVLSEDWRSPKIAMILNYCTIPCLAPLRRLHQSQPGDSHPPLPPHLLPHPRCHHQLLRWKGLCSADLVHHYLHYGSVPLWHPERLPKSMEKVAKAETTQSLINRNSHSISVQALQMMWHQRCLGVCWKVLPSQWKRLKQEQIFCKQYMVATSQKLLDNQKQKSFSNAQGYSKKCQEVIKTKNKT